MPTALRLSDLDSMTESEREKALERLAAEASGPANGHFAVAEARVRAFEQRYEMTSAELLERLNSGAQKETAEVAQWLFWLALLERRAR